MPKTFNITHEEIISQENLLIANKNASDCKRFRDEILAFQAHRQENIISLHNDLTYYPEGGEPSVSRSRCSVGFLSKIKPAIR